MAITLSTYITQVRRLLHDANGNFWSDAELTDDINAGRQRLVRDTGCNRVLQTMNTVTSQELYNFSDLPQGNNTVDIININVIWGNTRIPQRYMSWTQFNSELRFWENYTGRPIAYTLYGPQQFYLAPTPDEVYAMELDTVVMPADLVSLNDVETMSSIWVGPVQFYAAYLAKYKEQSYGEAELFKAEYLKQAQSVIASTFTRRMPNPYSAAY